jgi:hypothetical protein
MNIWEEIEKLDKQIMGDKEKLRLLMQERKDLHRGIGVSLEETSGPKNIIEKIAGAESAIEEMEGNIVERTMKEEFVPSTQEEIANMRKDDDAEHK